MINVICIKSIDEFKKGGIYEAEIKTTLNRNIDLFSESALNEDLFIIGFFFKETNKVYFTEFITLSDWRDKQINSILDD